MTVSVVGLRCNNFGIRIDEGRAAETVRAARSAGIDFFDTTCSTGPTPPTASTDTDPPSA